MLMTKTLFILFHISVYLPNLQKRVRGATHIANFKLLPRPICGDAKILLYD